MPTDRGPVGNSRVNDWFYRAPETVEEPPGLPNEIKPLPPIIHAWKIDLPRLIKCDRKFIDFRSIPEAITDNQSDVLESFGVSLGMFVPPREPTRPPRPPRPPPSPPRRNFPAREGRCSAEPFVPAPVAARPWSDSTVIYERVVWIRPEVPSRLELSDAQRIPTPPQKSLETPKFSRFQTIRDGFRNMLADWFSVYGAQRDSDPEVAGFKDQGSQTIPKQSSPRRQLPLLPQPEESTKQKRKLPLRPDGLGYLVQEPSGPGTSGLYPRLAWSVRGPGPDPGSLGVPPTSRPEGYLDPRFRPEPSRYMIPHAYFVPQVYCAHLRLNQCLHQNILTIHRWNLDRLDTSYQNPCIHSSTPRVHLLEDIGRIRDPDGLLHRDILTIILVTIGALLSDMETIEVEESLQNHSNCLRNTRARLHYTTRASRVRLHHTTRASRARAPGPPSQHLKDPEEDSLNVKRTLTCRQLHRIYQRPLRRSEGIHKDDTHEIQRAHGASRLLTIGLEDVIRSMRNHQSTHDFAQALLCLYLIIAIINSHCTLFHQFSHIFFEYIFLI
ncbi:unnamed protein product [Caenorhabditis brenneri]